MSDPAAVAERQQRRQQGWIAGLIGLPFRLFGMLCGSLVLAILLEWIGMLFIPGRIRARTTQNGC